MTNQPTNQSDDEQAKEQTRNEKSETAVGPININGPAKSSEDDHDREE